jgi:hypothetical protein
MDKLIGICQVLESYYQDYMRSYKKSDKNRIENYVRNYLKTLPGELYLELNEGAASGLCKPGFFESDLSKCIKKLKAMVL